MFEKDELTQQELYLYKKEIEKKGFKIVLVDTILKPLENIKTVLYNPIELSKMSTNTQFVFYCDTGKTSKERLPFYRLKFPNHHCFSLKGGRAYWRPNYSLQKKSSS